MFKCAIAALCAAAGCLSASAGIIPDKYGIEKLSACVDKFNADDAELYQNTYPNSEAKKFLAANVPLFDCPDESINATYYFRWWTFRKHVVKTPRGHVITEFLPKVRWAGEFNTISCPAAHHIREGRWLRDASIVADYIEFWSTAKHIRKYSFWYAASAYEWHLARPNADLLKRLYPAFKANAAAWEREKFNKEVGLFWQKDGSDGMEISISGALKMNWSGFRATINSYMYGEYLALSKIALIAGDADGSKLYAQKAEELKARINSMLWDKSARFFKVMMMDNVGELSDVRELHGYTPWYFGIPPEEYSDAWKQLADEDGFKGKWGLTSAERRDPRFRLSYVGHECQWNGPVWPYSTSITLVALANLLNDYKNSPLTKDDYFDALKTYADSHRRTLGNGKVIFWIDENQNPDNGDWISRTRLMSWKGPKGELKERGKDYNHSTFNDLVITGLVGLRLGEGSVIAVSPLAPDSWEYFAIENVPCKGKLLSIVWDADGSRYGAGAGLSIFADGKKIASRPTLGKLQAELK